MLHDSLSFLMTNTVSQTKDGVNKIDAVCLTIPSDSSHLTERQLPHLDAILSLSSSDVEENITVFITPDQQMSTNAIKAIKDATVL